MKLYSYWRSGTSYRVRLALALKGIEVEIVPVNLLEGEHKGEAFLARNPQGLVPTLKLGDGTLISQSPAIIEYLDEVAEGPKLLPTDPVRRAQTRQIAAIVGCDIHPLQNLRVIRYVQDPLGHDRDTAMAFAGHWIRVGFEALERAITPFAAEGPYTMGEEPSVADCYLLPQIYAARRFDVDLAAFPRIRDVRDALNALGPVQAAHPDRQIDAVKS